MTALKKLNDVLNVPADIQISIDKDYADFKDFYDNNKDTIYRNLVELFKRLLENGTPSQTLFISAKIQGIPWNTDFTMDKKSKQTLVENIIPYFEETEDYEFCAEILDIYNRLN